MALTKQYQTYYGVHLNHWSETWGGITYNKILVKEYPNQFLSTVSNTLDDDTITFLYPALLGIYYVDDVAEGHISIYNQSSTTTFQLTEYTVSLKKTDDVPSNETILGTYTGSISSENDIPPEDYLTLPVYMNIEKQLVNPNEKLLLYISITHNGGSDVGVSHWNDDSIPDLQLKIPYASQG